MWALWWTRRALLVLGQSPFYTPYIFYPEGVTLLFHPLDVSDGLLAIPLYSLLGSDVAYNLIILLSFVLGGWGSYLLAFYLTGRRGASLIAGLVFAFSPYHFLRLDLGHLNLSTVQWIPFYALFLFKFVEQGRKRSALLAVFFLILNALNSWYYVIYCGLLSLAVVLRPTTGAYTERTSVSTTRHSPFAIRHSPFITRAFRLSLVLIVAVLLLSPLLLPMFQLLGATSLVGEHNPLRHSVDLYSFWVPGPPSTWADWFEEVWISYAAHHREPGASAYLGYTVIALSIAGIAGHRRRPQALWWLAIAAGFTLLAMGPQLQIDGRVLDTSLPYRFLARIVPAFSITGIPGRMVVMTSLALAMLSAYGLVNLGRRLSGYGPPTRQLVGLAAGLLIFLEYLAIPLPLSRTDLPDFYHRMGADEEAYAILDIKWDANFLLHAQTIHGKPLVGGWLARLPAGQAAYLNQGGLDKSFLYLLLGPEGPQLTDPTAIQQAVQQALADREVRYIIDHDGQAGPWLEALLGWERVYEAKGLVVYENGAWPW
jgi:hypothetical protein